MSLYREYIVVTRTGAETDSLYNELVNVSSVPNVPNRVVSVANLRDLNEVMTHYMLTDAEADQLKNNPRVLLITPETPPEQIMLFDIVENNINLDN
jgi:hypothetical protein